MKQNSEKYGGEDLPRDGIKSRHKGTSSETDKPVEMRLHPNDTHDRISNEDEFQSYDDEIQSEDMVREKRIHGQNRRDRSRQVNRETQARERGCYSGNRRASDINTASLRKTKKTPWRESGRPGSLKKLHDARRDGKKDRFEDVVQLEPQRRKQYSRKRPLDDISGPESVSRRRLSRKYVGTDSSDASIDAS